MEAPRAAAKTDGCAAATLGGTLTAWRAGLGSARLGWALAGRGMVRKRRKGGRTPGEIPGLPPFLVVYTLVSRACSAGVRSRTGPAGAGDTGMASSVFRLTRCLRARVQAAFSAGVIR